MEGEYPSTDPGTTTDPGTQSGTLTLRRDPDTDSFVLSAMPYPAKVHVYPTLTVNGQGTSSDQCHTTYTWTGDREVVVDRTTDKVNYMASSSVMGIPLQNQFEIRLLSPHSHMESRMGMRDLPRSVRLYSTLGGIWGYSSR